MTALVMPRAVYIHVPKTAGAFVTKVIGEAGIQARSPRIVLPSYSARWGHPWLKELWHERYLPRRRYTFAFVRYPPEWWRSYWAYRMTKGWIESHEIDAAVRSDDFEEFIEGVIEQFPGYASEQFRRFVGKPGAIDFVGRFEYLEDDLIRALTAAGHPIDRSVIEHAAPANRSNEKHRGVLYKPEQLERLCEVESEAIKRFYSESDHAMRDAISG